MGMVVLGWSASLVHGMMAALLTDFHARGVA
jgi:hypothetical protein